MGAGIDDLLTATSRYGTLSRGIHIVSVRQLLFHVRSRKRDAIAHGNSQALRDFIAHGGIEWLARQSSDKFQVGKALGFGGFFTRLNNAPTDALTRPCRMREERADPSCVCCGPSIGSCATFIWSPPNIVFLLLQPPQPTI